MENYPIPNSFPQRKENGDFSYTFLGPVAGDDLQPAEGRWSRGPSLDGRGTFESAPARPLGDEPVLPPPPEGFAQTHQMTGTRDGGQREPGVVEKVKDALS